MLTRRQWLQRSSVLALTPCLPEFLARSANAASSPTDTILVVVELTGGNDGLNTVVPFADDHYHKARPRLRITPQNVFQLDDTIGLHPALRTWEPFWKQGHLGVIQGVGYPNPNRSHFESMDIWHTADPTRRDGTGWLGRCVNHLSVREGQVAAIHVGATDRPLALNGSAAAAVSLHPSKRIELPGDSTGPVADGKSSPKSRWDLVQELSSSGEPADDLLPFVRRVAADTYTSIRLLRDVVSDRDSSSVSRRSFGQQDTLGSQLHMIARLIQAGFGTRIYYTALPGFDTHADQLNQHSNLLTQLGAAVQQFFAELTQAKQADRVVLLTFSEFGRRVAENGSAGTDHGAGSSSFVIGPAVAGGLIGKHPSLAPDALDAGDLRHAIDFRQIYRTLTEDWLGCAAPAVPAGEFDKLLMLRARS
jgi:uncharacterized protein (DUF1501 family)